MVLIPMIWIFLAGLAFSGFPVGHKIGKALGYGKKGRILWSLGFGFLILGTFFLSCVLPAMLEGM